MPSCMSYLGLTLDIFALGCGAAALGLEYWVKGYDGTLGVEAYSGLWKQCVDHPTLDTICVDFDSLSDHYTSVLNAVRSMVVIGVFLQLASIIIGCVSLVTVKASTEVNLGLVSAIIAALAGLFLMVGFCVYLEALYFPIGWAVDYDLNAGFILCVVGWILGWASAGLILAGTFAMKRQKLFAVQRRY